MLPATSEVIAALNSRDHIYCNLIDFNFNGTTIRQTDAGLDIEYSGNTYLGNGLILKIDDVKQTTDIRINEMSMYITIADQSILAILLNNNQAGRDIMIRRAYLNSNMQVINNPFIITQGIITGIATTTTQSDSQLQIRMGSAFSDWARSGGRRTNDASQQKFYNGDLGMEFATQVSAEQRWGGV